MALLTGVSEPIRSAMENITDTFSGADGSVTFVALCALVKALDLQARNGDEAAIKILQHVGAFSRLIDVAKM